MKHAAIVTEDAASIPVRREVEPVAPPSPPVSARDFAAVAGNMRRSLVLTLSHIMAVQLLALLMAGTVIGIAMIELLAPMHPWVPFLLTMGIVALLGLLGARLLAAQLTAPVVQMGEVIFSNIDTLSLDTLHCYRGRAVRWRDITADTNLTYRHARESIRQNQQMIRDLDEAREQAKQQNQAKSQFLANVGHELRTPLNAILGYAMLLHEDAADAHNHTAMADLERIQQAGRNLLSIINDILDLAKIETGRTTVQRSVVDLKVLANGMAQRFAKPAKNSENRFDIHVADDAEMMLGDIDKVTQCLGHLLGNAFKFTSGGTVTLDVSALDRAGERFIRFDVRDTGPGIPADRLGSLFEAFQQVDGSATRKHGGAGLGLALVRHLSRMMGGNCTVESELGKGSLFRLELPGGHAAEVLRAEDDEAVAASEYVETPSAEQTALVIDEDEAAVDLMSRWLTRMGYNVLSTLDGPMGLELARSRRPDLILLDTQLCGQSGYAMTEELRGDPSTANIPVILITVDDDRERGLRAGATEYLRKPVSEAELREVLEVYRGRAVGEVLVIEDDDDSADLVARCVAQVGFSSRRAVNGSQGLAMAIEKRPDAIVLDLAMPGMSGFEVLVEVSTRAELSGIPLIIVSGADITPEEHRALMQAGHRFMPKAASTPRQIAQTLKEMVS